MTQLVERLRRRAEKINSPFHTEVADTLEALVKALRLISSTDTYEDGGVDKTAALMRTVARKAIEKFDKG